MQIQARNRLAMSKGDLAARRTPGIADNASWVWVLPLPKGGYRIRAFEVRRELLLNANDIWDGNMIDVLDEVVSSIDEIDGVVARAGVDPDDLAPPWRCDFPL
jgi:hypothetical protein